MQTPKMQDEFNAMPGITALATGRLGAELTFSFSEVLKAIEVCAESGIAILGIELGEMSGGSFHTNALSAYDLGGRPEVSMKNGLIT